MSEIIDEHRQYLADRARVSAYERALAETVRPGDVVVDLASGTGILGLLACRAGAARVYAIEQDAIAGLASEIARANGYGDRIVSVRDHSTAVVLPERGDLLVCDQIGRFGLEADVIDLVRDARARLLRPGATSIPARVDLIAAPVEHARMHDRVAFWSRPRRGLDLTPAFEVAANSGYPARFAPEHLLGPYATIARVDLASDVALPVRGTISVRIERHGMLHGVGGWFEAQLSRRVTMTNAPASPDRIRRRQVFFPLTEAVPVAAGDSFAATFLILPGDSLYVWDVTVARSGATVHRSRQTTLKGMLFAKDDLAPTDPDARPRLTARGTARLAVLELCDGVRTVGEIERALHEGFPGLFGSPREAAVFVAEVLTRYAEVAKPAVRS